MVKGDGSAVMRLTGRDLRLGLPVLEPSISEEKALVMCKVLADHRNRYKHALKAVTCKQYELGQPVIVFNPSKRMFSEAGTVMSYMHISDSFGPCQYTVKISNGSLRVVNLSCYL